MARAIHPFPARMASEIALAGMGDSGGPMTVLDPMCGSGTVLTKGSIEGHSMIGYDMDPLAILMSRVATSTEKVDALPSLASDMVRAARRSRAKFGPWADEETERFARYWFGDEQYKQLARLSKQVNSLPEGSSRDALQVSLSRIIITKSPQASLAADTAHSRPHKVLEESNYDVWTGFVKSAEVLCTQLARRPEARGNVRIERRDARAPENFGANAVDLVITSPPYLNAIDYLRGHRLSLIWFGHSIAELRELRRATIGSEARLVDEMQASDHLNAIVHLLSSVEHPEVLPRNLLARYARDMHLLCANIARTLVEGGEAIVVVADSRLRGNVIPTGEIVATSLKMAGLSNLRTAIRDIPEGSRYLPVRKAGPKLEQRMKHEYVIMATKGEARNV